MQLLEIRYISPPQRLIAQYGDNLGRVYFDLAPNSEIRLTKLVEQKKSSGITQEAALPSTFPATQKNRALLERFLPNVVNRQAGPVNIEVTQNGQSVPIDALIVTNFDGLEFEIEPFGQSYLDLLKATLLSDIDFGVFEYTIANILAAWANRESDAMPMLANYGAWSDIENVTPSDLRFVFRLFPLMQALCCHVGWSFRSPIFQSGDLKHLFAYLSPYDWHWYTDKTDLRFVHVNVATPRAQPAFDDFTTFDEVYDPSDLYNNPLFPSVYINPDIPEYDKIVLRVQVRNLVVTLPPPPAGEPAYTYVVTIYRQTGADLQFAHTETVTGSIDQTVTQTLNFDYVDREATGGQRYGFFMYYANTKVVGGSYSNYILESADIYFRPDPPKYTTGDNIPLASLLNSEITGFDLLDAMRHLVNGRLYTDYSSKTIYLLQPYDVVNQDGTISKGFYKQGAPIDFRSKTVSATWKDEQQTRNRFLKYAFKDSSDTYLQSIGGEESFNRTVDLGTGINETTTFENALFESTGEILSDTSEVGADGVYMPALWDNEDSLLSFDISPRCLLYYGLTDQGREWIFEGVTQTEVPYFAQVSSINVADFVPVTFNGLSRDLYQLYYRRLVEYCLNGITYELLLTGGDDTYLLLDFRRNILIQDEETQIEMQVQSVRDHLIGSQFPLLVSGVPV